MKWHRPVKTLHSVEKKLHLSVCKVALGWDEVLPTGRDVVLNDGNVLSVG